MAEFRSNPDGTRATIRITDGYPEPLADWIKCNVHGRCGRAEKLERRSPRLASHGKLHGR